MEDKVEKIEALAVGSVEGIANFMEEIKLTELKYIKQFGKLKKRIKLLEFKLELKNLKGGENMPEEKTKHNPADFNQDGIVSEKEMNLYSFLQGISKESNQYYRESTANAQTNAKWMALGSMAFLALLFILDLLKGLVS